MSTDLSFRVLTDRVARLDLGCCRSGFFQNSRDRGMQRRLNYVHIPEITGRRATCFGPEVGKVSKSVIFRANGDGNDHFSAKIGVFGVPSHI